MIEPERPGDEEFLARLRRAQEIVRSFSRNGNAVDDFIRDKRREAAVGGTTGCGRAAQPVRVPAKDPLIAVAGVEPTGSPPRLLSSPLGGHFENRWSYECGC